MRGVSSHLKSESLSRQLRVVVFVLILMLALTNAFFLAQASLTEREVEKLKRDRVELEKAVSGLKGDIVEIYKKTGVFPVKLNQTNKQTFFTDNKTHIYYFYNTDCHSCEVMITRWFDQGLPRWVSNISAGTYKAEIYDIGWWGEEVAKKAFSAVGLPESEITSYVLDRLITMNNSEGFIFSRNTDDDAIRLAVTYLVKGGVALSQGANENDNLSSTFDQHNEILNLPLPIIFVLGISQGFNACLIALTSFIVAVTLQLKRGSVGALKRVVTITFSVFYVYLLLGFLFVSSSHILYYVSLLAVPLGLTLAGIGILHFAEVASDLYTGGWRKGEEARIPLFKTPQAAKKLIRKTAFHSSLYFDFAMGALFSFIKLPCIAPLFLTLIATIPSQPSVTLASIITLNFGAVLPILILGSLASIGFLKIGQLSEIRFKGRIVQRLLVGASLIVSAFFILHL